MLLPLQFSTLGWDPFFTTFGAISNLSFTAYAIEDPKYSPHGYVNQKCFINSSAVRIKLTSLWGDTRGFTIFN